MSASCRPRAFAVRFFWAACLLVLAGPPLALAPLRAQPRTETMADRNLRSIVERQKMLLGQMEQARSEGQSVDVDSFRTQLESLVHEYQILVQQNPDFAAAYAAYGYLLSKLEMPQQAMQILLKADHLDPTIPLVKNELGNFLAEDGKPLEAADYYRAAMRLDPGEPLYPYQLGTLLYEARDTFIREGGYTRDQLDRDMQDAFRRAAELAPNRIEFTYRYAESFYDLEHPQWEAAFEAWAALAAKAQSPIERQTMLLHEANVRIKQGRTGDAREILTRVTVPGLQAQKEKLVAELPKSARE